MSLPARYHWKIIVEVEGTDGHSALAKTTVQLESSWTSETNQRPFLECLCLDAGAVVRSIVQAGHVLGNGDAEMDLAEGFRE